MSDTESTLYPKSYGSWAGNPVGAKPDFAKCCEQIGVREGRWTRFQQCSKKRGHGPDGAYCKQHDPAAVKARQDQAMAKYKDQTNEHRYGWNGKKFYAVLEEIAAGHNDARGLAQKTIDDFKKDFVA